MFGSWEQERTFQMGSTRPHGRPNGVTLMNTGLSPATMDETIRRIVAVAHPAKIILFGSAARGEMGPHSDSAALREGKVVYAA